MQDDPLNYPIAGLRGNCVCPEAYSELGGGRGSNENHLTKTRYLLLWRIVNEFLISGRVPIGHPPDGLGYVTYRHGCVRFVACP